MLRQLILNILNDSHYRPLSYHELANLIMSKSDEYDLNQIYQEIVKLENEYLIIQTKHETLQSIERLGLKLGTIEIKSKGYGFVRLDNDEDDVFISKYNLNNAIDKDRVLIKMIDIKANEGSIERVLEHGLNLIVGEVFIRRKQIYVSPDNKSLNFNIKINYKNSMGATNGHKVVCVITSIDDKTGVIHGKIKNIIGHINDVDIDILSVVYEYGFNPEFSREALDEAKNYQKDKLILNNRIDLRDKTFITIDGADSKDLDDAIYLEKEQDDYILYVSIADVSYYVREDTNLNKDAYERGTSVYLTNKVVPMLPFQLSNDICSLNPDTDRYTLTCQMKINNKGKVIDYDIYESMINSKYRLTYEEVNNFYNDEEKELTKLNSIALMLNDMLSLSKIIRTKKIKDGYIDFDIDEIKIITNNKNQAIDIVKRVRGLSEKLIEDFMIKANEVVAENFHWLDLPSLYRVHDKPNKDKLLELIKFAKVFNINFTLKKDEISPYDINHFLELIKKSKQAHFLDKLLLRSMAKAVYQPDNIGHFGLASHYYTHFTSPIRRYPDLIIHRLIRKYLIDKDIPNEKDKEKIYQKLIKIGEHASKKERDAQEAERKVTDMKCA
ncbi:MAG: ribonuclease R, partial [Bacilli bacterium]|nr:ribonuclease R [Bacilli bacterium]